MTDTVESSPRQGTAEPTAPPPLRRRGLAMQAAVVLACAVLGFALVAQLRATEEVVGDRLAVEREEDLARILATLTGETDRLQAELTDLRLTLMAFESSAEQEELALRSLQRRLEDLSILAGIVEAEGSGIHLTIDDPDGLVTPELLVDVVQELRDAGAEAIAVNDVRLVVSSSFVLRNNRLVVDGQPLEEPYRFAAVGSPETLETALAFPGGAIERLENRADATSEVEALAQLTVPARASAPSFVFGQPIIDDAEPEA